MKLESSIKIVTLRHTIPIIVNKQHIIIYVSHASSFQTIRSQILSKHHNFAIPNWGQVLVG